MSWGHKIVYSVYVQGEPDDEVAFDGAEALATHIDCEFVGCRIEDVEDEPQDQVAT